jgi:hypothetical protein
MNAIEQMMYKISLLFPLHQNKEQMDSLLVYSRPAEGVFIFNRKQVNIATHFNKCVRHWYGYGHILSALNYVSFKTKVIGNRSFKKLQ